MKNESLEDKQRRCWRELNEKRDQYDLYMNLGKSCPDKAKRHNYFLTAEKFYAEYLVLRKTADELYDLPPTDVPPPLKKVK